MSERVKLGMSLELIVHQAAYYNMIEITRPSTQDISMHSKGWHNKWRIARPGMYAPATPHRKAWSWRACAQARWQLPCPGHAA